MRFNSALRVRRHEGGETTSVRVGALGMTRSLLASAALAGAAPAAAVATVRATGAGLGVPLLGARGGGRHGQLGAQADRQGARTHGEGGGLLDLSEHVTRDGPVERAVAEDG